ncbi:MAG: 4'-phosphopantetheinyl transferase superfamily protein [Verrucomicrobia bacterium]|nr:4'-phosphopantetheinyl transferase superfamily protein [Verrucomicrobiota bacterium]
MDSPVPQIAAPPPAGEIHLWLVNLQTGSRVSDSDFQSLSADELRRAEAYRFERDRCRFVVARALLRKILAAYTGMAPDRIEFAVSAFGKPSLANPGLPLHFNLSHSGDQALMAFSMNGALGVDLEQIASEDRLGELLRTVCSDREQREIQALPSALGNRALLRLWTAKEAFLKALGTGLQIPLRDLEVDRDVFLGHRTPGRVLWRDDPSRSGLYQLLPLPGCEVHAGASAALAIHRPGPAPRLVWINPEGGESPRPRQTLPRASTSGPGLAVPRG